MALIVQPALTLGGFALVSLQNAPAFTPVLSQKSGGGNHQVSRQPRRNVVGYCIQVSGEPADVAVFHVFVADHRVKRVDDSVDEGAWDAEDGEEEEWCGYAVGGAFSDGFDGGGDDLPLV